MKKQPTATYLCMCIFSDVTWYFALLNFSGALVAVLSFSVMASHSITSEHGSSITGIMCSKSTQIPGLDPTSRKDIGMEYLFHKYYSVEKPAVVLTIWYTVNDFNAISSQD